MFGEDALHHHSKCMEICVGSQDTKNCKRGRHSYIDGHFNDHAVLFHRYWPLPIIFHQDVKYELSVFSLPLR